MLTEIVRRIETHQEREADLCFSVAQELGLHREASCLSTGPEFHAEQEPHSEAPKPRVRPKDVDLKEYQESVKVMLFWCVFIHDTSLVSHMFNKHSLQPLASTDRG